MSFAPTYDFHEIKSMLGVITHAGWPHQLLERLRQENHVNSQIADQSGRQIRNISKEKSQQ